MASDATSSGVIGDGWSVGVGGSERIGQPPFRDKEAAVSDDGDITDVYK